MNNRERDAAGQSAQPGFIGAPEIGVEQVGQYDGTAGGPGLAGQALVVGEHRELTDLAKLLDIVSILTAAIFQRAARRVGNP